MTETLSIRWTNAARPSEPIDGLLHPHLVVIDDEGIIPEITIYDWAGDGVIPSEISVALVVRAIQLLGGQVDYFTEETTYNDMLRYLYEVSADAVIAIMK